MKLQSAQTSPLMSTMKFPLLPSPETLQVPESACCLVCGNEVGEGPGYVRLTVGAILFKDKSCLYGGPSEKMQTVFALVHQERNGMETPSGQSPPRLGERLRFDVAVPTKGGQVDLIFCSSKCLRELFGSIVDAFEKKIEEQKK